MANRREQGRHYVPFVIIAIIGLIWALAIRDQYLEYGDNLELSPTTLTLKKDTPTKVASSPNRSPITAQPPEGLPVGRLPLKVPFTTQAPAAVWDPLHEEACEEASLLMVYYYRTGQKFASPVEADAQIKKLVTWQEVNGYKVDLTAEELVAVAAGYLKLKSGRVIDNPTVDQLKAELDAGRPLIVPAAGRLLSNPYFTPPGPIYHMLVLKSYDQTGFIVNDPGTRRGESYHYSFDRIMTAMHDWDPDNILNGQKAVVVFD